MQKDFVPRGARITAVLAFAFILSDLAAIPAIAQALVWRPEGPRPNTLGQTEIDPDREVEGAIRAVAPHPTESKILYVGAVNGGIWKTENALAPNPDWRPLTDGQASL